MRGDRCGRWLNYDKEGTLWWGYVQMGGRICGGLHNFDIERAPRCIVCVQQLIADLMQLACVSVNY